MDLDAYVARARARVAAARGADPPAPAVRARRPTSSSSATSRSPPTCRWCAPRRPTPSLIAHLSSLLSRARNRASGTRTGTWRGVRRFFADRFPAALYRLRWWWLGTLAANVVVTAVMMLWLLGPPERRAEPALARREVDQLVNHDFEDYYSEYAASHFAAQVWVNNAWVTALCLALGVLGLPGDLPAVPEHRQPRDHRLDHDPPRPWRALLGAAPPARAAGADGGLRRRRCRAEAVLVVGRARRR